MRNYVGDCELFNSGSSSSSNSTSAGVNSWRVVVLIKCNMWHNYKFTFNTNKALSNDAPVIVTPADSYLIMIKVKINNLTLCHINAEGLQCSDAKIVIKNNSNRRTQGKLLCIELVKGPFDNYLHYFPGGLAIDLGLAIKADGLKTQQFASGIHRLSENDERQF
uniref:Uncharacterized protein n=1 Tax=Glossina austeni TaxID=7395 RepID=A0A1A9URU9_GLOAU